AMEGDLFQRATPASRGADHQLDRGRRGQDRLTADHVIEKHLAKHHAELFTSRRIRKARAPDAVAGSGSRTDANGRAAGGGARADRAFISRSSNGYRGNGIRRAPAKSGSG